MEKTLLEVHQISTKGELTVVYNVVQPEGVGEHGVVAGDGTKPLPQISLQKSVFLRCLREESAHGEVVEGKVCAEDDQWHSPASVDKLKLLAVKGGHQLSTVH